MARVEVPSYCKNLAHRGGFGVEGSSLMDLGSIALEGLNLALLHIYSLDTTLRDADVVGLGPQQSI